MKLYTCKEAAEILRCSPRHVQKLAKDGLLQGYVQNPRSYNARWLFSEEQIQKFLDSQLQMTRKAG